MNPYYHKLIHEILKETYDEVPIKQKYYGIYDFEKKTVVTFKESESSFNPVSFETLKQKSLEFNKIFNPPQKKDGAFFVDFSEERKFELHFPFSYDIKEVNPTPDDVRDAIINIILKVFKESNFNAKVNPLSIKQGYTLYVHIVEKDNDFLVPASIDESGNIVTLTGNTISEVINEYKEMYHTWYGL